jgi:hypothetical protein
MPHRGWILGSLLPHLALVAAGPAGPVEPVEPVEPVGPAGPVGTNEEMSHIRIEAQCQVEW